MGIKKKVSSSKMDSYKWCNRRYRLRTIEKIKVPFDSKPMRLGSILHKEINTFWKKYNLDLETFIPDINAYYDNTVKKIAKMVCDENYIKFQMYFSNFTNFMIRRLNIYTNTYNNYREIKNLFYPILSEKYYTIPITDDIDFGFIVDSLFKGKIGNILIDWKSDNICNESQFVKHIPQLDRYSSGLSRVGRTNSFVGIYFLRDSLYFQDGKTHGYSLENEVLSFVRELQISKFSKVPFKENYKCSAKDYQCEYYPKICNGSFV